MSHGGMGQASDWRVAVKGEQRGPYTLEQVRAMIAKGQLPADALVWRPGMANWAPWESVPELVTPAGRGPMPDMAPRASAAPMPPIAASLVQSSPLADFLAFRTMLTPVLIKVLFWVGVVACFLLGLGNLILALRLNSITELVSAVLIILLGPIFVRVWCEMLILFFRIHETLVEIKDQRK